MQLQTYAKRYLPQPIVDVLRMMKYRMDLATFQRRVVTHRYGNHYLQMNINDRVAGEWYDRDWVLPPEVEFFSSGQIPKDGRVFDLGAHQCLIAMLLARELVPEGSVIAVEANRHNADIAKSNIDLNGVDTVEVLHALVSKESGKAHADFSFNSRAKNGAGAIVSESIDGVSIDDLSARKGWPDLVYLDIEGFEIEALKGARQTLSRWCHWFIELHGDETLSRYGARNADILNFFDVQDFARYVCLQTEDKFRLVTESEPVPTERCFLIFAPAIGQARRQRAGAARQSAMKIIYYQSPNGNFGDDLNAVLWKELLSPECFAVEDAVLLGIGSIFRDEFLSEAATRHKRVFVLGSGAGTGPLPQPWPNADWSILAVRGPLTARLIGVPDAAITDSAALLAATPALLPKAPARRGIAFMPHYNSVQYSRWPEICAKLGLTYIDPHCPVAETIEHIGSARLVVTEAMHGAIVADTLRVPWVPVLCSPAILPFKWIDWTESLDLDFRPVALPPSSAWEALKGLKIRAVDGNDGIDSLSDRDQDILDDFHRRYGGVSNDDVMPKRLISRGQAKRLQRLTAIFDHVFSERAAAALVAASKGPSYLSKESIFLERVDRLQTAVAKLQRALLGTMH